MRRILKFLVWKLRVPCVHPLRFIEVFHWLHPGPGEAQWTPECGHICVICMAKVTVPVCPIGGDVIHWASGAVSRNSSK